MLVLNIEMKNADIVRVSLEDNETGHVAWSDENPQIMVIDDKQKYRFWDWIHEYC